VLPELRCLAVGHLRKDACRRLVRLDDHMPAGPTHALVTVGHWLSLRQESLAGGTLYACCLPLHERGNMRAGDTALA
jgi:hypothetical protein